jgi:hypothetical protein
MCVVLCPAVIPPWHQAIQRRQPKGSEAEKTIVAYGCNLSPAADTEPGSDLSLPLSLRHNSGYEENSEAIYSFPNRFFTAFYV